MGRGRVGLLISSWILTSSQPLREREGERGRERVGELISSWILTSNQPLMGWVGGGGGELVSSWILTSSQPHRVTRGRAERERERDAHMFVVKALVYTQIGGGVWGRLDVSICV